MNENFDLNEQTFKEAKTERIKHFIPKIPYGLNEKSYNESREIKKISRLSSGAFLTIWLFSFVYQYVVLYALVIFGFSIEKAYEIITDPYVREILQVIASSVMFLVPFTLFFKCGGYKISGIVSFNRPKSKNWFPIVLMGVGFCSFANIAVSVAGSFFEGLGINYDVDFGESPTGFFGVILTVISTAVIPPLVEEFACRGLMIGALKKYGEGFAIISSAIMFGIMHGNFQQAPFAFLIGLIMGFVTVKCGSIWPAILIHAYNNLSSVIFTYAFIDMPLIQQNVIYTFYLIICLFVGIIGLGLLKNDTSVFKLSNGGTEISEKKKYNIFFLTETAILFLAVCIYDALQYFNF